MVAAYGAGIRSCETWQLRTFASFVLYACRVFVYLVIGGIFLVGSVLVRVGNGYYAVGPEPIDRGARGRDIELGCFIFCGIVVIIFLEA